MYSVTPPTFHLLHRNTPHCCVELTPTQSFLECLAHEYSVDTGCTHYWYHRWYLLLPVPALLAGTPSFRPWVFSAQNLALCRPLSVVLGTDMLSHMRGTDGGRISESLLVPAKGSQNPFSLCLPVLTTSLFSSWTPSMNPASKPHLASLHPFILLKH